MKLDRSHALSLPPVLLWGVFVALMASDAARDPFDPTRTGTGAYGHNGEGALGRVVPMTLIELAVTLIILQPWRPAYRGWRGAGLLALLAPWALISVILMMHAGGVMTLHGVWMVALVALVALCVASSAIYALHARMSAAR